MCNTGTENFYIKKTTKMSELHSIQMKALHQANMQENLEQALANMQAVQAGCDCDKKKAIIWSIIGLITRLLKMLINGKKQKAQSQENQEA